LNCPELNTEKFIPNPFSKDPQARLYRTGDLARYQPDGNIEFLGRFDNQVRSEDSVVEPEEVESVLKRHCSVKDAVVVAKGDAREGKRLVAYIIRQQGYDFAPTELCSYLKDYLPHYMLPQEWFTLDIFPLTPTVRLTGRDYYHVRVSLLNPQKIHYSQNYIERRLVKIWAELLNRENIGTQDDFLTWRSLSAGGSLIC